ncbi:MAG: rhomboid family intramembrane serine protease [Roseivirga sp.]
MNSILEDFKMAFRSGNILNQIIIINVVVFITVGLISVFLRISGNPAIGEAIYDYLALRPNLSKLVTQPLSFITYQFMHSGFRHILFNMLILYWFGKLITEYLGQNKVLGLYLLGGLGGGLAYVLMYNLVPYYETGIAEGTLVGASAGVLAVVVGAATFQPDFSFQFFLLGRIRIIYVAAVAVVMSVLSIDGTNAGGEIAHLGGALLGFVFIKQLQKGNDWSKPVAKFLIWGKSFFVRQPKIKVSYKNEQRFGAGKSSGKTKRSGKKSSAGSKETSQAEIDAILDKISEKGYDALSKEEKQKLFNASNK